MKSYFLLIFLYFFPLPVRAGSKPFAPVRVVGADIKIDGRLLEPVWNRAEPITTWYRQTPNEGSPPSQITRMWLIYDAEAIYLAARMQDTNLDRMMVRTLERDSFTPEQDAICLFLDTYNDNLTAYGFIVTPAGVRTDIAVANDGEGRFGSWNIEWNTFWEAAAQQDKDGWSVEMRIPFSSLRFESKGGEAIMGAIMWRYLARNAEYDVFPAIPNKWRASAFKPSQAIDIRFEGISKHNPVYFKPYSLGGIKQANLANPDNTGYYFQNDWKRRMGLDVKYNLTSNLIVDITMNTDFAQVEVDDQRINTTRFSLFFPEKRAFFQERSALFTYRFPGGPQRLFQSRRIGIVNGQQVPILGGVRLTGRSRGWDIGFIEMQTGHTTLDSTEVPSENFGVLRVKREVFERGSFVGGMFTSRTDFQGHYNLVLAIDGDIRFLGPQYVKLHLSQSVENGATLSDSWYSSITVQRRIQKGFSFGVSGSHYGYEFNPGIGFLTRTGVDRFGYRLQYTWYPGAKQSLQSHTLTLRQSMVWSANTASTLETFDNRLSWDGLFKSAAKTRLVLRYRHEFIFEPFSIGEVEIAPEKYNFLSAETQYKSPSGNAFRYEIRGTYGGYFGGRQIQLALSPSWTVDRHFAFALNYEFNHIAIDNEIFKAHLMRLRFRSAFNRALSINAFIQYNSDAANLSTNIRFHYNPAEGNDLYFVYNENLNTELNFKSDVQFPLPRMQNRTILLKYSHTFIN
ncbi:MAG: hypothetical protein D6814_02425 [Calditrichaeota bacterium]|nr:MAG: hypothetical protein D6814_02425 [Calditrichota bacterium]